MAVCLQIVVDESQIDLFQQARDSVDSVRASGQSDQTVFPTQISVFIPGFPFLFAYKKSMERRNFPNGFCGRIPGCSGISVIL